MSKVASREGVRTQSKQGTPMPPKQKSFDFVVQKRKGALEKYQKSLKLNIVGPLWPTTINRWIAQEREVCAKRYAYWSKTCFWVKIDARLNADQAACKCRVIPKQCVRS